MHAHHMDNVGRPATFVVVANDIVRGVRIGAEIALDKVSRLVR